MALDVALVTVERSALETARGGGSIDTVEFNDELAQLDAGAADPVSAAIDGLIDDELIRQGAAEQGLSVAVDVPAELEAAATARLSRRITYVSIVEPTEPAPASSGDWPRPAPPTAVAEVREQHRSDALDRARSALVAGTSTVDIVAGLRAAGWLADGDRRWIANAGPVAPIPDGLLVLLRDAGTAEGSIVGPVADDVHGRTAIGVVIERGDAAFGPARDLIATHGLDGGVVEAWAKARALARALEAELVADWQSQPQAQVRAAELVVGSAALEGPSRTSVELAHLVVDQVPAGDIGDGQGGTPGERIASRLRGLDRANREAAFFELVSAANATPADDPLRRSGELSFYSRDQVIEPLAPVFADTVTAGDIVGPVTTSVGEEIYLVRARFTGILDERANAALVEARTATDLGVIARRISPPGDADRADGERWRSELELGPDPAVRRAFSDTPIGTLSDPFVLDGQLLVVRPLERRTAPLEAAALDRLRIRGFDTWLASRRSAATIVIDHDPLGLGLPTPSASEAPTGEPTEAPRLPSAPAVGPSDAATFALPTPQRNP